MSLSIAISYLHFTDTASYPSWYTSLMPRSAQQYTPYARLLISCLFVYNICLAALPAIRSKDDLSDVLLTPTQRNLLGLNPNVASSPVTPGANYITPPRYSQSPTPRNSSPTSRTSSNTGSVGSRKDSPFAMRQGSGSPFSASPSPMWHKAVGSGRDSASRRASYGSPSPLGPANLKDLSILGAPNTPSPSAGRGSTVGLNSKWLYERGRSSPSSRSIYS